MPSSRNFHTHRPHNRDILSYKGSKTIKQFGESFQISVADCSYDYLCTSVFYQ